MGPALPVTVLGGYLGAGKTTLVNSMLRQAGGRRLAVLVNDFGDLSIDADLIRGGDDEVLQLAGGCVCCTIGSDLMATLGEMRERFGNLDHVLLEASGVALPGAIAASVGLIRGVRRSSVVVLVAADRIASLLADRYLADTIERQVGAADLLVLTHADGLDDAARESVRARLAALKAHAPIVFGEHGALPIDVVLEPRVTDPPAANFDDDEPTVPVALRDEAGMVGPDSGEIDPPAHGSVLKARPAGASPARFTSLTFAPSGPVAADAVCNALADPALGIERAKGIFPTPDGGAALVHGLGSRWIAEAWAGALPSGSGRMVIIGLTDRLATDAIAARLPEWVLAGRRSI